MNGQINKKIIKLNWPELLEIPFNPDDKYRLFYKSRLVLLCGAGQVLVGKV